MKLINTGTYLLLLSLDESIVQNDYYWHSLQPKSIFRAEIKEPFKRASNSTKEECFKIVAYYPLTNEAKELDLPLLPPFDSFSIKDIAKVIELAREGTFSNYNYFGYVDWDNTEDMIIKSLLPTNFIPEIQVKAYDSQGKEIDFAIEEDDYTTRYLKIVDNIIQGTYKY